MSFKSSVLFLLLAVCSGVIAQDDSAKKDAAAVSDADQAKKIVKDLRSDDVAVRREAVRQLIKFKGNSVVAVVEFAKLHQDHLETVARCGDVLTKIAEESTRGDFAQKIMTLVFEELDLEKFPGLSDVAKEVQTIIQERSLPTVAEARVALREARASVFVGSETATLRIEKKFEGNAKVLRMARAFRKGLRVAIDLEQPLELYEVLPTLKIKTLEIFSQNFGPIPISAEQVRARMNEVGKCNGIQELVIFVRQFPVDELKFIESLSGLVALSLPGTTNDDSLKMVAKLKKLKRLGIVNCESMNGRGLKLLEANKELISLNLYTCSCEDKSLQHIRGLKSLTSLSLPQHATNETLKNISVLTNLTHLQISNTKVTDEGIRHLLKLKKLEHLGLDETPVTGKCIPLLNSMMNLADIFVSNTFITKEESAKFRLDMKRSRFDFKPANAEERELILGLVEQGIGFGMHTFKEGRYAVQIFEQQLQEMPDFKSIAKLPLQSLNIAYPLTVEQAQELCQLDEKIGIVLGGKSMKDEVAEMFHEKFKYVADYRNGKKRITNKWKR